MKKEKEPQENETGGSSKYYLKNHDHAWSKCLNNPISKNFCGMSYTDIPANKRYENIL